MKTTKWLSMMLAIVLPLLGVVLVLHLFSGFAASAALQPQFTSTIIIEKQTVPDGAAGSFTFTDTVTSPYTFTLSDNGKQTFSGVTAGIYTVTEDDPMPGFFLTGLTCEDDTFSDSFGIPLIRTAYINLQSGETVTCTFTNTALAGPITVVKELIDPPTGMAVISNTITYTIWITNTVPITVAELPLLDYYCPACMEVTSWSVTPTLSDTVLGTLYWADLLSPTLGGPDLLPSGEAISVTVDFHAVISDTMYWKEKWHDYALSGMPDFDQKQDEWGEDSSKWTYCGPMAAANSLWWFDSKFEDPDSPPPPIISDSYPLVTNFGNSWDDHDPRNVISLTNKLAELMKTSTVTGTQVNDLADGIEAYIAQQGLTSDYSVTVVVSPTFQLIEDEVRRSEDAILLLGFWQIRWVGWPIPWPEPFRIGGHYVTVAGVDSENSLLALSDPFFDRAEIGLPWYGRVRPNPHLPLHPLPGPITDTLHNDAWFASHDVYLAAPSFTPGGTWQLPYILALDCEDVSNFEGQNEGDWENGGECIPESPIYTEIEYMVAVSPITPTVPCAPTNNVAVVSGAKDDLGHDILPWVQDNVLITITAGAGTIVIEKVTDPAGGTGFGFSDTIKAPNSFNLDHGQTQTFDDVLPGTYTVTETNPAPAFDLVAITCDDGSSDTPSTWDVGARTATVNLDASETVTCTFTNTQRGTIVVEKQTDPDGASGTFDFTDDVGTPLTFSLSDGQTQGFTDVVSGTYTITETNVAPGFDLSDITCSDDNSSGNPATGVASVSLQPGEIVTCTFTNTKQFTLTVNKAGTGTGTVTSAPAGINCGADCTEDYDVDTAVTLTATPDAGSRFAGWSGDCSGVDEEDEEHTTTVTMDADKTCTATFNLWTPPVPVGGVVVPVNRLALLAPWMGLAALMAVAVAAVVLRRRKSA